MGSNKCKMLHRRFNRQILRDAWNKRLKWKDFLYKLQKYFLDSKHTLPYYSKPRIPCFKSYKPSKQSTPTESVLRKAIPQQILLRTKRRVVLPCLFMRPCI